LGTRTWPHRPAFVGMGAAKTGGQGGQALARAMGQVNLAGNLGIGFFV